MASNIASSGASYEAVVIDMVTAPIDRIIDSLGRLEAAFQGVTEPARDLATAMNAVRGAMEVPRVQQAAGGMAQLTAGLTRVRTAALSLGQGVSQGLNTLASGFKAAGGAALAFGAVGAASIYKFVQAASDAAETQSKFNIAFSESKDEANAWAMTMSSSLGRSQTDLKNYSSTMKTMLDSAGFTDQMASAMAKSFTVLAVDMASFNNMAEDDVFYRLMSGINGSTEALERFGINLKASAMDEKLLQLGLSQTNKDLTENQKKMLRTIILFESQADTVGDAVRTYDQFANQLRSLKAVFTDFAATVGNYMINMLLPTMRQLNDMLVSMSAIAEKSGKQMVEAFVTAAGVASALGAGFVAVGISLTAIAGIVITLSTAISGLAAVISLAITTGPWVSLAAAAVAATGAVMAYDAATSGLQKIDLAKMYTDAISEAERLKDVISDVSSATISAITEGDWKSAWEIVTKAAEVEFYNLGFKIQEILADALSAGAKGFASRIAAGGRMATGDIKDPFDPDAGDNALMRQIQAQGELERLMRIQRYNTKVREANKPAVDPAASTAADAGALVDEQTDKLVNSLSSSGFDIGGAMIENAKLISDAAKEGQKRIKEANSLLSQYDSPFQALTRTVKELDTASQRLPMNADNIMRVNRGLATALQTYKDATTKAETRDPFYKSTGSTASGFASRIGAFAGTVDVGKETKKQTKLQDEIKGNTKETADLLGKIVATGAWTW